MYIFTADELLSFIEKQEKEIRESIRLVCSTTEGTPEGKAAEEQYKRAEGMLKYYQEKYSTYYSKHKR